jgi:hypothetical protein
VNASRCRELREQHGDLPHDGIDEHLHVHGARWTMTDPSKTR